MLSSMCVNLNYDFRHFISNDSTRLLRGETAYSCKKFRLEYTKSENRQKWSIKNFNYNNRAKLFHSERDVWRIFKNYRMLFSRELHDELDDAFVSKDLVFYL